ncbi:MAG: SGNH/GDSL hydrolase family protein [Pirellulales bacterium]|nr:SGNH/GDSL hydrolase family protein [Pirellulales bacterium]
MKELATTSQPRNPQRPIGRITFGTWGVAALLAASAAVADEPRPVAPRVDGDVAWYDVTDWGVEGKGWSDTKRWFDRLPERAEKTVRPPVWDRSRNSAGMSVRFETDAIAIQVRYRLLSRALALPHMPASGVSGLDLYARHDGRWVPVGGARPTSQRVDAVLCQDLDPGRREFRLYLPLYNGVEELSIGVPRNATFVPLAPRAKPPIVFYGTSINQGGCASRPGMVYTAILDRRLDWPIINLGFSGNGEMDMSVADLLGELDAAVYVIDCLPNMSGETVAQRAEPFVRRLRAARPETPIVLVEDRTYDYTPLKKSARTRHAASRAALRAAYEKLVADGVPNLRYVPGADLLGPDSEGTVDGSHPTDLGMTRIADCLGPVLERLLPKADATSESDH